MSTEGPRLERDQAAPVRRRERAERTRLLLLDAARVVFRRVDWPRARVEDVCREAGVAHGTFYSHFSSKSDVLGALVQQHASSLYEVLDAPARGPVHDDVRRVVSDVVDVADRDRDISEILLAAAPVDPALRSLAADVRRQTEARIGRRLRAAKAGGAARADLDVDVAAVALGAMLEQTVALAPTELPGVQRERLVRALTSLWVHAIHA